MGLGEAMPAILNAKWSLTNIQICNAWMAGQESDDVRDEGIRPSKGERSKSGCGEVTKQL